LTRLANEYEAAVQAHRIEALNLPSYAGAWFDSATQTLHVATNNSEDFGAIAHIGATPVLVDHSLTELEAARKEITAALASAVGQQNFRASYVDSQTNAVVLAIDENAMVSASMFIATQSNLRVPVRLKSKPGAEFSTDLHGADGTQNYTWILTYGGPRPCSVGASAEEVNSSTYTVGYATAGHCGEAGNIIQTSAGVSLGNVAQSTYAIGNGFQFNEDGGWVSTGSGWTPQPQVNGYTNGTLNVSGTWAGTLVAPVGTTACRYGEATQGPHCASVSVLNESVNVGGFTFNGMIEVDGICTGDGDSGGTLISPANQVQGTVTGGSQNSCPDSSGDYVYFQPITTTLARAKSSLGSNAVAMLTSHGRSAPTLSFRCPDMAESGGHTYQCDYPDYDSQGLTTTSWTTNTGASSSVDYVADSCLTGQTVNVTLTITNPYGTTTRNGSFLCPTGPKP